MRHSSNGTTDFMVGMTAVGSQNLHKHVFSLKTDLFSYTIYLITTKSIPSSPAIHQPQCLDRWYQPQPPCRHQIWHRHGERSLDFSIPALRYP